MATLKFYIIILLHVFYRYRGEANYIEVVHYINTHHKCHHNVTYTCRAKAAACALG